MTRNEEVRSTEKFRGKTKSLDFSRSLEEEERKSYVTQPLYQSQVCFTH